ncbi:NUDIX hydrolase [Paracoccus sp. (in: a-proteobacteria)]|uniref:NUDIX hydrolase n=1 Tax=Paracoccus sp. TaxID=267 RepID=UPI0028A20F37|nr:NUDIX hydrolase [Paracoccus sp. (in: a-proteobacteria)]
MRAPDLCPDGAFSGAKLLLTCGEDLLTYLRDDFAHIPFPAFWDLPGGGREGEEAPIDCALRELFEEFGLILDPKRLSGQPFASHHQPGFVSWLFRGQLTLSEIAAIRFGDEGQEWRMMPLSDFINHPRAVPHFREWVRHALANGPEFQPGP